MLSYQTLDNIADAYIPALAILCLCLLIKHTLAREWQRLLREGGLFVLGLVVAYFFLGEKIQNKNIEVRHRASL